MRGLHVVQALKNICRATSGGGDPHGASISPMGNSIGVAPTFDGKTGVSSTTAPTAVHACRRAKP
jgi:hypothetical protein